MCSLHRRRLDLDLPQLAENAAAVLDVEEARWRRLWDGIGSTIGARVIQHAFVVPDETPLGHLALRLPGSKLSLVRELNARLGAAAGSSVLLVDCERLASRIGKQSWLDPRLWQATRQPVSHAALPLLARETAAVLAGDLGLAARCLVVDLDNTLWGGLVGEEGPEGITVGEGPEGEAYAAFQEYLLALARRGVLLAVASKNDAEAARAPFEQNPRMRLGLGDFAAFVADWRRKPEQVAEIAERLGFGLDAIVFADDNPAECSEVATALPAVDTVPLDVPPSELVRTLASSLRFESATLTAEDVARQASYGARAQAEELRTAAVSLEDFWRSLEMRARVRDVDASSLERSTQLTQKTNQFNLTLVRRTLGGRTQARRRPVGDLQDARARRSVRTARDRGSCVRRSGRGRSGHPRARHAAAQLPRDRPHCGGSSLRACLPRRSRRRVQADPRDLRGRAAQCTRRRPSPAARLRAGRRCRQRMGVRPRREWAPPSHYIGDVD